MKILTPILSIVLLFIGAGVSTAFPTTGVLDTMNRANENPLSDGGQWTVDVAFPTLKIVSDQAVRTTSAAANGDVWNAAQYKDAEVYFTINTPLTTSTDHMEGYVRFDTVAINGYAIGYWLVGGVATIRIEILTGGALTTLASWNQTISSGDSIGLRVVGNTLTGYYKPNAGAWQTLGQTADTTYPAAGYLVLEIWSTTTTPGIVNFGGGPTSPAVLTSSGNLTVTGGLTIQRQ